MFFNPNIFFAVLLVILSFALGDVLGGKTLKKPASIALTVLGILLALPALSFVLYYIHLVDEPIWYIEYRSLPYIEILSGLVGFICGLLAHWFKKIGKFTIHEFLYFLLAMLLCIIPFIKPILLPVTLFSTISDKTIDDVCMQSTPSTCGPCSAATVLKFYGIEITEKEIAKASFSSATGTEIWYLIRYLRNNNFDVRMHKIDDIFDVPTPAIVGTKVGWAGHFIALLEIKDDKLVIGDSLVGRLVLSKEEFYDRYKFEHFVFEIIQT